MPIELLKSITYITHAFFRGFHHNHDGNSLEVPSVSRVPIEAFWSLVLPSPLFLDPMVLSVRERYRP
jgi:hypothetical protein